MSGKKARSAAFRRGRRRHDVRLHVDPGKTVRWQRFSRFPRNSLAVDGYCHGRPRATPCKTVRCINHHEEVDRLATRSSVGQAIMLVKMGLVDLLSVDGRYTADLYVNDCDQDVIWATYVLMHPEHVGRPLFQQLANLADMLDTTMGFYPVKRRWHLLRRLLWISEPYAAARAAGRLNPGRPKEDLRAEMIAVIDACHSRIRDTLYGRGRQIEPDTRYGLYRDFGGWQLIHEIGSEARLGIAENGVLAYVGIVGDHGEAPYRYVIHRRSELVRSFPVRRILRRLNAAEGYGPDDENGWGGSGDNGGGSPRANGSSLSPDEVCEVVAACIAERSGPS